MTNTPPPYRYDSSDEITAVIERPPRPRWFPNTREAFAALMLAIGIVASMAVGALAAVGAMAVLSGR